VVERKSQEMILLFIIKSSFYHLNMSVLIIQGDITS